jgi:putative transposase
MDLIARGCHRIPMRVLAYCLMPSHFHFVLWPQEDGELSRWMHWLLSTHVRRYHTRYGTSGRVWQGRFKGFPIQEDRHLLTVLRYVERNPIRADLVSRAEDWQWSSLHGWLMDDQPKFMSSGPVPRFAGWAHHVNDPQTEAELEAIRLSSKRESPHGDETWKWATAGRLDLLWTLRGKGRPHLG